MHLVVEETYGWPVAHKTLGLANLLPLFFISCIKKKSCVVNATWAMNNRVFVGFVTIQFGVTVEAPHSGVTASLVAAAWPSQSPIANEATESSPSTAAGPAIKPRATAPRMMAVMINRNEPM